MLGALRLIADERGSVVVIAAVALPVLVGAMGLGAEVGYWYVKQRGLQHAADLSAYSAGVRRVQGDDNEKLKVLALQIATETGFRASKGSIQVNRPPISGPSAGDTNRIEVILDETLDRYFTSVFSRSPVRVKSRAVATITAVQICALALNTTANSALAVKGSSFVQFDNCVVASNSRSSSSVDMQGSASFTGDCIYAVGGFQQGGSSTVRMTKCKGVETNSAAVADPYANVAVPTATPACVSGNNVGTNNVNTTVTPTLTHSTGVKYIRYCSLSTQGHVTFQPGLYIIDGGMSSTGQSITGAGVTFVVGGNVNLSGNLVMKLSAPTSGPFSGILFFGNRNSAAIRTAKITGSSGSILQGAVYFPTGDLEYTGSSASSDGCTQLIANTIAFAGSSAVRSSCAKAGTRTLNKDSAVALSE
jgi:Flp pilus assembly protein TadG